MRIKKMIPYYFILLASLGILFLLIGLIGKIALSNMDSRTYSIFILASGIIFIFLALIILGEGLDYNTGKIITQSFLNNTYC